MLVFLSLAALLAADLPAQKLVHDFVILEGQRIGGQDGDHLVLGQGGHDGQGLADWHKK